MTGRTITSTSSSTGTVSQHGGGEGDCVDGVRPGDVLGQIYRVVRCLGVGRTGVVYLCELIESPDELTPQLVGLKVLSRTLFEEGESNPLYIRFYNEIDAIFRVAHPNVLAAFQFVEDGTILGYSMEYLKGGDLSAYLKSVKIPPIASSISILDQMASGVEAIHRAGVVHRDLKPENLLLTEDMQVKISDFGVAFTGNGPKLTARGAIVGTMQYLSPEYLERGIVSRQGDIYAMGVIAYELFAGKSPFAGLGAFESIERKVQQDPPNLLADNSKISPKIAEVVTTALSRDPSHRYRSAIEFRSAIREAASQALTEKAVRVPIDLATPARSTPSVEQKPAPKPQPPAGPPPKKEPAPPKIEEVVNKPSQVPALVKPAAPPMKNEDEETVDLLGPGLALLRSLPVGTIATLAGIFFVAIAAGYCAKRLYQHYYYQPITVIHDTAPIEEHELEEWEEY